MSGAVDPFFWQVARWLLAGVFAAGLWHKWRAGRAFVAIVDDYRLLPPAIVPLAAAAIVLAEGGVFVGLVFSGAALYPAALLAIALLGVYWFAIAVNLARGRRNIDCGCLGPAGSGSGRHRLSNWLLLRNAALIGIGAALLLPQSGRDLLWLDAAGIAGGVAAGLLLYFTADQLVANRPVLDSLLQ